MSTGRKQILYDGALDRYAKKLKLDPPHPTLFKHKLNHVPFEGGGEGGGSGEGGGGGGGGGETRLRVKMTANRAHADQMLLGKLP